MRESIEERLTEWACWVRGDVPGLVGSILGRMVRGDLVRRLPGPIVPQMRGIPSAARCRTTHEALASLSVDLQRVVVARYYESLTMAMVGVACGVCRRTAYNRLRKAHHEIAQKLAKPQHNVVAKLGCTLNTVIHHRE